MSHPFGDLLSQYRFRKHGLSQRRLAELVGYDPSLVAKMAKGRKEITGPSGRERVVRIIDALRQEQVLTTVEEANALLASAHMSPLFAAQPMEAALMQALRPTGAVGEAVDTPARHNLRLQLTHFIGRAGEIAEVRRLIVANRLVTLTGAGGVGKTRLAVEVGAALAAAHGAAPFPDGVWLTEFAPLTPLTDPALIPQTVATVFHLPDQPGRPHLEVLATFLRDKHLFLILDNCEHMIQACAELAEALLRTCPHLHLLVTSRENLRVPGEVAWRVPSLSTPDPTHLPLKAALDYEAVQLFLDRAARSQPGFALTPENVAAVAKICHRLDGIPLAIELAAARLHALPVEHILAHLDDRFSLLTDGSRTAPSRQQTLRATIDWSYQLLSEEERVLFRHLAVFAGGWTLVAARVVTGSMDQAQEGASTPSTFTVLLRLADKSLVTIKAEERGGERGGEERYDMLETIRAYALEQLTASGEAQAVRRRHAEFYLAFAEQTEPSLYGPEQMKWQNRLERELDNFRAAIDWAFANGETAFGIRLVAALDIFLERRGFLRERREQLLKALVRSDPQERTSVRAKLLNQAAFVQWFHKNHDAAHALLEEALSVGTELGDKENVANSIQYMSYFAVSEKDFTTARSLNEKALTLWRELGNMSRVALTLGEKAEYARLRGDYDQAQRVYEEAIALFTELGEKYWRAVATRRLGRVARQRGDYTTATALCQQSLKLSLEAGHKQETASCLATFAGLAVAQEQGVRAVQLFGAVEALLNELGVLLYDGDVFDYEDDLSTLRAQLDDATFNAAWAQGKQMTLSQTVEYALQDGESSGSSIR